MTMQTVTQQTDVWDAYYAETDPELRKQLLEDGCEAAPDEKLNALRRELWNFRYTDPKDSKHRVDRLLWQCVNFVCIYRMSAPPFLRKGGERDVKKALAEMGLELAEAYGEAGRAELYREYRNATQRYLSISYNDKYYRKKYFGILSMKNEECKGKMAEDIWKLSIGVIERFHLQNQLELFSRAVRDEFVSFIPDAQKLLEQRDAAHHKKTSGSPSVACPGKS